MQCKLKRKPIKGVLTSLMPAACLCIDTSSVVVYIVDFTNTVTGCQKKPINMANSSRFLVPRHWLWLSPVFSILILITFIMGVIKMGNIVPRATLTQCRLPDVIPIPMPTCLYSCLPQRSVQTTSYFFPVFVLL